MEEIKSKQTIDISFMDRTELASAKRFAKSRIINHLANQMYLLKSAIPTEKRGRDILTLSTELVIMTKREYEKLKEDE